MKKILFVLSIVSMSLVACVGGTQDSSSECANETKKECCSTDEGKKECCSSKETKKECSSDESNTNEGQSNDDGSTNDAEEEN